MSAEPAENAVTESEPPAESPPQRSRLTSKHLQVGGLLLLVMVLEAIGIYLVLPRPAQPASDPQDEVALDDEESVRQGAWSGDTVEVEVDAFSCTNGHAVPGAVFHVSFKLVAVVSSDQQSAFKTAVTSRHKSRVRQAVLEVVRSASLEDLNDPQLRTIKRQLREEINKVLHKSYVIEAVISEFNVLEQ